FHLLKKDTNQEDISPESPLPGVIQDIAPSTINVEGIAPFPLLSHIADVNQFPFFNWAALEEWAAHAPDQSQSIEARQQAKRAWLLHLRNSFGSRMRLYEASHAYLLSPLKNNVTLATAKYVSITRTRIEKVLAGLAQFPA